MNQNREEFDRSYRLWKERIAEMPLALASSDRAYIDNAPFRAMVQLGWAAVPAIMEKLRTEDGAHFLVHALREITGQRPGDRGTPVAPNMSESPAGNQAEAARWLAWWEEREHRDDVRHP